MELLERDHFLHELKTLLDDVATGNGHVVLVGGEAGIGKTSLVEHFAAVQHVTETVLWGVCEALFTPRPLGPLHDVALHVEGDLRRLLESESSRTVLFSAFLDVLQRPGAPVLLVVEDLHWADEATLDLLKFVGRRIHRTNALLVVTYRDDEVGPDHPLRFVLGDLPRAHVSRLWLVPLSEGAVASLARQAGHTDTHLYEVTGGNPFFVTEVLANGDASVPVTVRDAVLARVARLSPDAREVIELVSVVPGRAERWLVDEILAPTPFTLDECAGTGMLRLDAASLSFRHELARLAVEESLPPSRRRRLHEQVLDALSKLESGGGQVARLVHHAAQAEDGAAVLRFAPLAARQAAALSAHREAAAHYSAALRYADGLAPESRAALFEGHSFECYLTDQIVEALAARHEALRLWEQQGDARKQGESLRWMSRLHWFLGQKTEAEQFAETAIRVLESLPSGPELAMAYSNRAQLHMLADETDEAVRWGTQAITLAEQIGATETLVHALNNVGSARLLAHDAAGAEPLERSLRLALAHDFQEHAARAYTNLSSCAVRDRDYACATRYLDEGIAYAAEHDLDSWRLYITAWRARARFEQGDWSGATDDAEWVLARPRVSAITKIPALAVLGHVRVRRGDPDATTPLDEGLHLALQTRELQRIAPVVVARAEAAFLKGRLGEVQEEVYRGYEMALQCGEPWMLGELAFWMWHAGALTDVPQGVAPPYALHIDGKWRAAAEAWQRLGCPYEQALALSDGDAGAMREALVLFEKMGAEPAAERLRRRMRAAGLRGIPRGQRTATRVHPGGLTPRQVDVLALLAEGLTNVGIAGRLYISAKTADHHVSAILAKLGVHSREEAAALAAAQGWLA